MMFSKYLVGIILLILLISSCSVRKHLPKNTYLYNGASVKVNKASDNPVSAKKMRKTLTGLTFPDKNSMILGYAYKVGFWYAIGDTKRKTGLKYWLKNRLGEPPVLSTMVSLKSNEENLVAYAENKGFFKTEVTSASVIKGYKMKALYTVMLPRPYLMDTVKWSLDTSTLSKDILSDDARNNYVKTKEQFDIENIKAEAKRTDLVLKRKGYYYFSPDYIKTYIDTSLGNHKANLYFSIKKETPAIARQPQFIKNIVLFPNYTLIYPLPDTSKRGLKYYDGIYIRDTLFKFTPRALTRPVTYRAGDLYNQQKQNETLNRYIKMGAFKFVKSRYEQAGDSAGISLLNVFYYLTPLKKKTLSAEIGGFTKTNSFTGAQVNVSWKNRNLFKGAEQLIVKTYGAVETSSTDTLQKNNNWRLGGEASLLVPRFIVPFKVKESNYYPPFTRFTLGYEYMRRQLLYTKNFFRFQYDLNWKTKGGMEHSLAPVSVVYNNATAFSDEYLAKINVYPVLQFANRPELILGSFYNFSFSNNNNLSKNILFFNANADVSGNIAGLFKKANAAFDKTIAGAYYTQYVKVDADIRYTRKLTSVLQLANRLAVGIGTPYGNSAYLPFSKQFIIGGSNSLRGFRPRQLGPGRALTTADQQITYPQIGGDYKLELQTELRFPIVGRLKGAIFADAGNIWTKDSLLFGEEGKLTKRFINDIAADAGLGFRFDINILIIRLDIAIPLRKPWLPMGSEWTINDIRFGNKDWRKENLIFNIGIGYPF